MGFISLKKLLTSSTAATVAAFLPRYAYRRKYTSPSASFPFAALLRHSCTPKPTSHEPSSYIINPSPAAADPDHHNNTVKFLLKRRHATNALYFSEGELPNVKGHDWTPLEFAVDSPYFEKTNSMAWDGGFTCRTMKEKLFCGIPPPTNDVLPAYQRCAAGTYRSDLISSCFGFDSASGVM